MSVSPIAYDQPDDGPGRGVPRGSEPRSLHDGADLLPSPEETGRCYTPYPYAGCMAGYEMHKDDYLARLKRIEGQVRGLQGMLERLEAEPGCDDLCEGVLTQILAVRAAVEQVGVLIMELHMRRCVLGDVASKARKT